MKESPGGRQRQRQRQRQRRVAAAEADRKVCRPAGLPGAPVSPLHPMHCNSPRQQPTHAPGGHATSCVQLLPSTSIRLAPLDVGTARSLESRTRLEGGCMSASPSVAIVAAACGGQAGSRLARDDWDSVPIALR